MDFMNGDIKYARAHAKLEVWMYFINAGKEWEALRLLGLQLCGICK